jgi:hypothetical protein
MCQVNVTIFCKLSEITYLMCPQAANIRLTEYEFNNKNVPNLQAKFVSASFTAVKFWFQSSSSIS